MADETEAFGVVLFHTNSAALRAEKILKNGGLTVKLIPTPREYSSDCGVALRFIWSEESRVRIELDSMSSQISSIQKLTPFPLVKL